MRIIGLETSCDETGVAIYDGERGLLGHRLYSQADMHAKFGGVVPELASRDHVRKLLPLVQELLDSVPGGPFVPDGVAYTSGPGLIGALLVGAATGRALAYGWGVPAMQIHHMEGHLLAPLLETPAPEFPFLALLVSGGHTLLVRVDGVGEYEILGETRDDAAGEAFDKTAKLLGLPYPGGPRLAELAEQGRAGKYSLPRPMTRRPGLDFSFSGLKTAVRLLLEGSPDDHQTQADIARAFEDAIVDTLAIKCRRALTATGLGTLVVAGGVGANLRLRARLAADAASQGVQLFFPRGEFCTDNGAMIAYAGWCRLRHGGAGEDLIIHARPRWSLAELARPV